MTNTINNLPAHIAARVAARQSAGHRSSVASAIVNDGLNIPRISIRASRYRLVEEGQETVVGVSLDTIIVGANPKVSKVFYSKQFDPNADNVRPDCFSNDGIKPDPSVEKPVCSNCQNCPNNVLGSKITQSGAKSKLCADQRHMAVVPAADPNKVYSLTIPVSSMKALREYFKELGQYGVAPEEVITELGFDDQATFPKMTFRHKGFVPERAIPQIDKLLTADQTLIATRQKDPRDTSPALAAPANTTGALPQQATPQPVAVDDAYEDEAAAQGITTQPAPAPVAQPAPQGAPAPIAVQASAPVAEKPVVNQVKASSELEKALDNLFEDD